VEGCNALHRGVSTRTVTLFILSFAGLGAESFFEAPGVANFHQVNDHVFRGAQPHRNGLDTLAK
jgi:hypothetical protein